MNDETFSALKSRGISEILRLRHKIRVLEDELESPKLSILENKNVLIAIPSVDKFGNQIREENPSLFFSRWSAAHDLNIYLHVATNALALDAAKKVDGVEKFTYICGKDFSIDYLILLYEFTGLEKTCIEQEVKKNHLYNFINQDVKVIDLY